ncbi:MAG TPA: DUF2723 domain-containing protein [Dehalococcoidia bacterium]|nr:DUF2723 domain-containing protein [Dehalococcoidia bacterium]
MAVAEGAITRREARARPALRLDYLALPLVEVAAALGIFALALFVYNATLTPSLSYESFDGNELATIPYQLGLAHSTGYPLYTWAGKLFTFIPIGDVAHRINLMSAAGAAGGCALLFAIILMSIRGSMPSPARGVAPRNLAATARLLPYGAAATGALMLAFSTTLWSQAVIAEVYAPNVFMVGLTFLLLLLWGRYEGARLESAAVAGSSRAAVADGRSLALFGGFALAFGLSLGTHMSNLALAPGFIAFVLLTNWRLALQPGFVLAGALGFGLGALQFAWLPYKASGINDAFMARNTPDDLEGIYNYTLNAFPQFKWAFPLSAIPDRVVMYLEFLRDNFRWPGIGLAVAGGLAMAVRNPRAFFLFAPAYVAQMAFFLEYRAADIDVFFITAHFIVAVFIGYGVAALGEAALAGAALVADGAGRWRARAAAALAAVLLAPLLAQPAVSLARAWDENDQSDNTGINDFYELVFERLPSGSVLIGRGGVFGYDMFYWRYVYNVRPDVDIPLARGFNTRTARPGAPTFTVAPPGSQGTAAVGPGAAPRGLQPQNAWYWPILAAPVQSDESGFQLVRQLTLYEARNEPPPLFVSGVTPKTTVNHNFGAVTLVGYDIDSREVERGGAVHLKLYWRLNGAARPQVATRIGETEYYESHELGFGNLQRLSAPQRQGELLVEEYDLVVLSSIDRGDQPFRIRVSGGAFGQTQSEWVEVGRIRVK